MAEEQDWLSRKEAAAYLTRLGWPIAPQTLAKLGCNGNAGKGPRFTQWRWRTVRYLRRDLDDWARRNRRQIE